MAQRVFSMPDLGEGLEGGKILTWLVQVGQSVGLNQPLVEVETAKAAVEIPSPYAGVVASLHADSGDEVSVGAALVTFDIDSDGDVDEAGEVGHLGTSSGAGVAATPAVRRLARDLGVDLSTVTGSGPQGRVTREDVNRASSGEASADTRRVEISPVRRAIAQNLSRMAAIPQVTTFRTLDCSALQSLRGELEVSPLPIFVAGLCRTLRSHPLLNASWAETAVLLHERVHVGIAADTERGLVVPVVRDAGERGIVELATEIGRLAEAARGGKLSPGDLADPTVGVSNTGSYGSEAGTPLLTPGCAVTVALGVIAPRALVVDGEVLALPACTLSLTFDHRVLDGAAAGRALTDLVGLLGSAELLGDLPR